MAVANREYIEEIIYGVMDRLDPSGTNTNKYKAVFQGMDDKGFEKFMKEFLADNNEQFVLDIVEFDHSLTMENCEAAAKYIDIPLMEYVYMPHLTMDKSNVVVSKQKCLVTYANVKRTQQLLHKKNGLSVTNERRSADTGQVVGDDKNARDSDIEAAMLVTLGASAILQELHGPRADDPVMRQQMRQSISTKGYALLDEMDNVSINKVTLNTTNTYLIGMGIKSDLVTDSYILPGTSKKMFQ